MQAKSTAEPKKSFLQNDRLLVCSMLVIYGVCILGLVVAVFWGLNRRATQRMPPKITRTPGAFSTPDPQVASTAMARYTEHAGYDLIDRFDSNANHWMTGRADGEFWDGTTRIEDGVYRWNVTKTRTPFFAWAEYPVFNYLRDFDVYVDTKILDTGPGDACSGFLFRMSPKGWDDGGYYFGLCNDSTMKIYYHTEADGWEPMSIQAFPHYLNDWNRLEISARGSHFRFLINGELVHEMDDNRVESGALALTIELNEKVPAVILFDNFGFQNR